MGIEEKKKAVEQLKEKIEKNPVLALIEMRKMPSRELQEIRKELRGKAEMKMTKKIVMKYAFEKAEKENIKNMEEYMPKQPAMIITDMDGFKLYSIINNLRFKTFAKEGDTVSEDVWVSQGPTGLMAGPAISELQQVGIPASIEGGKIVIKKDKKIAVKGEELTAEKANAFRKLKIKPKEVVLDIVAIYDKGDIYTEEALRLTIEFPKMLPKAFQDALNLSVSIAFPTKQNITYLISKASRAANAIKDITGLEEKGEAEEEGKGKEKEDEGAEKEVEEKKGEESESSEENNKEKSQEGEEGEGSEEESKDEPEGNGGGD